jgi:hypothetical protein
LLGLPQRLMTLSWIRTWPVWLLPIVWEIAEPVQSSIVFSAITGLPLPERTMPLGFLRNWLPLISVLPLRPKCLCRIVVNRRINDRWRDAATHCDRSFRVADLRMAEARPARSGLEDNAGPCPAAVFVEEVKMTGCSAVPLTSSVPLEVRDPVSLIVAPGSAVTVTPSEIVVEVPV